MHNNLIDNFRRNPLTYILVVLALMILLPIVLRIALSVMSVAALVAGTTMSAVFSVLGAILLLVVRFAWLAIPMLIIWWVVSRRPNQTHTEKKKGCPTAVEEEDISQHYDENGDVYYYEDEYFSDKRKRSR
jgi:membrane protein implicated in regulation of membrane protease activity